MRMTIVEPCRELAPYVQRFTVVEAAEESTRVLLPDPGVVVGFRYAGHARLLEAAGSTRLPDFVVTGLRTSARRMRTSAGGGIVVAVFREAGAASFFSEPLHELFGSCIGLDAFVRASELARLGERLATSPDARARVGVVERFLLARRRSRAPDRLVRAALSVLQASGGSLRVAELARRLDIGVDRLEKRFRQEVGATPKQLGSLYRLLRAMDLHRSGLTLTASALEAGYADQAHFTRGFRAAMGEAPRRFLASAEYCGSGENERDEWRHLRATSAGVGAAGGSSASSRAGGVGAVSVGAAGSGAAGSSSASSRAGGVGAVSVGAAGVGAAGVGAAGSSSASSRAAGGALVAAGVLAPAR